MILTCDDSIQWTQLANQETALVSLISNARDISKYIKNYSERLSRFQPWPHYEFLYKEHKDLLNDIVSIFFPTCTFIPSNINKNGTTEQYMWEIINAIFHIAWYNNIENSRPRGYEKTLNELEKARIYISGYADSQKIDQLIDFPGHQNETLEQIENFFIQINRPQQGLKIADRIKKHFGITKVTATKKKKMINANKKFLENYKEKHGLTDEELKKVPILGQLQTEI